ncbi:Ger(x)C family spore germination protein [Paenibacillaceae bacterium]|nr:Ger(x)C family spore germination protein [Paenibacillaceae bacterium]
MKIIKKTILLIVVAGLVLTMTSCRGSHELNELHIVHSIAIDKAPNEKVLLTAEIAKLTASGQQPKGMQDRTFFLSAEGDSLFEAGRLIRAKSDRTLLWGHAAVILISQAVAKQGIEDQIKSIRRLRQFRNSTQIYISEDDAYKTLQLPTPMASINSQVLRGLTEGGVSTALTQKVMLIDVYSELVNRYRDLSIPSIRIIKDREQNERKLLQSSGLYIFRGDKLAGLMGPTETMGYLRSFNKMVGTTETLPCGAGKTMTFENINNRSNIQIKLDEQMKPSVRIDVYASLNLNSTQCDEVTITPKVIADWENKLNEDIRAEINQFIRFSKKHKSDLLGIGEKIHRKFPKQWSRMKEEWRDTYSSTSFTVDVETRIDHTNFIF